MLFIYGFVLDWFRFSLDMLGEVIGLHEIMVIPCKMFWRPPHYNISGIVK